MFDEKWGGFGCVLFVFLDPKSLMLRAAGVFRGFGAEGLRRLRILALGRHGGCIRVYVSVYGCG